ncbi:hypothetical protein [Dyadobacter fermentans]|uniref:Uncharacterized protein n=1 Tax=Dyadobacter fermentans (strain ATCC 700827 / DSM 18053 / CIP 107007 / KCTC 52180 / NS114) TaxID=471854 RepID=C6VZA4_DYAFD|nr:hypothetical protein [Dyadobacter fermentans]ACT91716.1 hypothetical protein Dfer_0447 [Dyadobacter fermentans DSM 18053]
MNPGFDPEEIALLKEECKAENSNFIYVEDEFEDDDDNNEHAHVQFVGTYKNQEVIFDALIYTLRLHHSTLVYDEALERLKKEMPNYISQDERPANYKISEEQEDEAELLLTEFIEEIEENEEITVREHVEIDDKFEYGVGLEVGLNKTEINDKVISDFIEAYTAGKVELDPTLFSFTGSEDED